MDEPFRHIDKDEFFYVVADNYDEHIEVSIPFYRTMHDEMLRCLADGPPVRRVLDLGAGTGKTAALLLRQFPDCRVVLIDLFDEMLAHARRRLAGVAGRAEFVQDDFMTVPFGEGFDACVSALAIHHQTAAGKEALFRKVRRALRPGGRFAMIDWTEFDNPRVHELAARVAEQHAAANLTDPAIVREWADHWRHKNIPDSVEDMSRWLREAGFRHVDCVVRYYGMALLYAEV